MQPEILVILQAADDPHHVECLPAFDWNLLQQRLQALRFQLEEIVARDVVLDDKAQDATFFGDLTIQRSGEKPNYIETIFAIRFSNFGNLFTTWSSSQEKISSEMVAKLVHATSLAGFKYVPPEQLRESYTGPNVVFEKLTWWDRYFDYT